MRRSKLRSDKQVRRSKLNKLSNKNTQIVAVKQQLLPPEPEMTVPTHSDDDSSDEDNTEERKLVDQERYASFTTSHS